MKIVQICLAGIVLMFASCATSVGVWEGGSNTLDTTALRGEVEKSLIADSWVIVPTAAQLAALKAGPGGPQTWAYFTFTGGTGGGSQFQMAGKSHHRVNWLTFGILGLSLQGRARAVCAQWYETWAGNHPTTGSAAGSGS